MNLRASLRQPSNLQPGDPRLLRTSLICLVLFVALFAFCAPAHADERKTASAFRVAAIALAAGGAVDVHQSVSCVRAGRCAEVNPAYRPLVGSYVGMGSLKAAGVGGVILALRKLHGTHPRLATGLMVGLAAGQGAVVGWNARQARR